MKLGALLAAIIGAASQSSSAPRPSGGLGAAPRQAHTEPPSRLDRLDGIGKQR